MSKFDALDFFGMLAICDTVSMDAAFADLAKAPPVDYAAALEELEDFVISPLKQELERVGAERFKAQAKKKFEMASPDDLSNMQTYGQIILHIGRAKDEQAGSLLKAFVTAAEKLTDEELNSAICLIKPISAAADAFAAEKTASPFRPKTPGL